MTRKATRVLSLVALAGCTEYQQGEPEGHREVGVEVADEPAQRVPNPNDVGTESSQLPAAAPVPDAPSPDVAPSASSPTVPALTTPATSVPQGAGGAPDTTTPRVEDAGSSAGEGNAATPVLPRGPTPRSVTSNFPFPQNRHGAHCVYPSDYDNADVVAAFEKWKADTVTADGANGHLRVKRPNEPGLEPNSTVSEGIAYGMLIAVYMDDQHLFDELWKYEQQHLDPRGLMDWYINAAGDQVLGGGAASDADEDMAWALVMADRQWGGSGTLDGTYLDIAKRTIDQVWQHEIMDGKLLKPGDSWGDWGTVNVSYFMPNYYRTFAVVSGNAGWNDVVVTSYDTLENTLNDENGNRENGLVPAWATSEGQPNAGVWGGGDAPTHYQYDSCRTPFRIGVDYCFHGEPRALDYVTKTTGFFAGIGVPNIVDGYDLDGTPRPEFGPSQQSAAFVGPAGVGAMGLADQQAFVDAAYDAMKGLDLLVGGTYYEESWTVLSLLMMTGNFLDYTVEEPLEQGP